MENKTTTISDVVYYCRSDDKNSHSTKGKKKHFKFYNATEQKFEIKTISSDSQSLELYF